MQAQSVFVILEPFDGPDGLEWCAVRAFHDRQRAFDYRRAEGILPPRPFPLVALRIVRRDINSTSVQLLRAGGLLH